MKVEERVRNVTSNFTGEKIAMKIDEDSFQHIASVLTDLYSDQELAVIREYSTNAYDSHIEAGISRPIEISLPTALSPFFRVRDYGVGLNVDDIREVYSKYGASTKRNSNDVVGMLGLGCKSALTYTDQFTVTGVHSGMKTTVSVSRDENNASSMTIISEEPTTDPSGVEIIVPAKSGNQFQRKALEFFRFWDDGTVLVDGAAPQKLGGIWIADDILFTKELKQSYVVMGNVPYPVADRVLVDSWQFKVVSFVKIGSVSFVPSREALMMTNRTKETLAEMKARIETEKNASFQKQIEAVKTPWEAIDKYFEVRAMGYNGPTVWWGKSFDGSVELPADDNFIVVERGDYASYGKYSWSIGKSLFKAQPSTTRFFVGYESDNMTPYRRQKLAVWASQENVRLAKVVFCKTLPKEISDWVNPKHVHKWADVEAIKIVREKRSNRGDGRPTGSYNVVIDGARKNGVVATEIDTSKPLFWEHTSERYGGSNEIQWLTKRVADCTIVLLSQNRIAKFKRDFPMAKNTKEACREIAQSWLKGLSEGEKAALCMSRGSQTGFFSKLNPEKVNDPWIKKAIEFSKIPVVKIVDDFNLFSRFGITLDGLWQNPISRYDLATSLLRAYSGYDMNHLYCYLNAAYDEFFKAKNDEKEVS